MRSSKQNTLQQAWKHPCGTKPFLLAVAASPIKAKLPHGNDQIHVVVVAVHLQVLRCCPFCSERVADKAEGTKDLHKRERDKKDEKQKDARKKERAEKGKKLEESRVQEKIRVLQKFEEEGD